MMNIVKKTLISLRLFPTSADPASSFLMASTDASTTKAPTTGSARERLDAMKEMRLSPPGVEDALFHLMTATGASTEDELDEIMNGAPITKEVLIKAMSIALSRAKDRNKKKKKKTQGRL